MNAINEIAAAFKLAWLNDPSLLEERRRAMGVQHGRSANLLDLAGSVPVPTGKEGASIEENRVETRKRRAARSSG